MGFGIQVNLSEIKQIISKMEYGPYKYFFERRLATVELVKDLCPGLSMDDMSDYVKAIGKHLFEFRIQDKFYSYTVLKTYEEVQDFFRKHSNGKNDGFFAIKKVNLSDFETKENFELKGFNLSSSYKGAIPQDVEKFFEMQDASIYKIKSSSTERKIVAENCLTKCYNICSGGRWESVRVVITREGILEVVNNTVRDYIGFDSYFMYRVGARDTKHELGINMTSAHRRMKIRMKDEKDYLIFLYYLKEAAQSKKKNVPYFSSSMVTTNNDITYLVDAESYYKQVVEEISKAKRQIYMLGWWVSPELYLVRPVTPETEKYQLFKLLDKKATEGVKINIIVYHDPPKAVANDSEHTKLKLERLHPNIKVERHPFDIIPSGWSHHEKLIVVDYRVGLMGGLDVCYGRYDSHDHPIEDNSEKMYPGIDYNNVRIRDFVDVKHPEKDLQSRQQPRMPWHDVAYMVKGRMVGDLVHHFVQYWNFTQMEKKILPKIEKQRSEKLKSQKLKGKNSQKNEKGKMDSAHEIQPEGAEILDAIIKMNGPKELSKQFHDNVQSQIQSKKNKEQISKFYKDILKLDEYELHDPTDRSYLVPPIESLGLLKLKPLSEKNGTDTCQLLRSASEWSIGLEQGIKERSIQNAYLELIEEARQYIYIENQFFISATGDPNSYVKNQVATALFNRIKRAIEHGELFKVVIFIPHLPGMEGVIDRNCPMPLRLTLHWEYTTISRGPDSLVGRVRALTDKPDDYIQFYSLRQHGVLDGKPVTELIYIHTKLMIVDDDKIICGSANINDRSQEGDRDSELAVLLSDGEKVSTHMNGKSVKVNRKAHELRKQLYMEHFGISSSEAEDPISSKTEKLVRKIAEKNTEIYRDLFGVYPDDNLKKFDDIAPFGREPMPQKYLKEVKGIRGHAVQYPLRFLEDQNLMALEVSVVQDIFT